MYVGQISLWNCLPYFFTWIYGCTYIWHCPEINSNPKHALSLSVSYCLGRQHHTFTHSKLKTSQFNSQISFLPQQITNHLRSESFSVWFPTFHPYYQYLSSEPLHIFVTPRVWILFFFLKILFIHERHTERGRDTGRGKIRLPVWSQMWDSIPGPQDCDLSLRQMINDWATLVPPRISILTHICSCILLLCNTIKLKCRTLIKCLVHDEFSINICWTKHNWGKMDSLYLRRFWGLPLPMKTLLDRLTPDCVFLSFFNWSIVDKYCYISFRCTHSDLTTLCIILFYHKCSYHLSPYNTIKITLTIFPMYYLLFPWLIHSITENLDLALSFTHFVHPPHPPGNHWFVLCIYKSVSTFLFCSVF